MKLFFRLVLLQAREVFRAPHGSRQGGPQEHHMTQMLPRSQAKLVAPQLLQMPKSCSTLGLRTAGNEIETTQRARPLGLQPTAETLGVENVPARGATRARYVIVLAETLQTDGASGGERLLP